MKSAGGVHCFPEGNQRHAAELPIFLARAERAKFSPGASGQLEYLAMARGRKDASFVRLAKPARAIDASLFPYPLDNDESITMYDYEGFRVASASAINRYAIRDRDVLKYGGADGSLDILHPA